MSSVSWNALSALGLLAFVAATFLAISIALVLALWPIVRERRRRTAQASLVRSQFLAHLKVLRESVMPRSHPLDLLQRDAYEPLHYLWMQTHLLEAEKLRLLNRCNVMLLTLRNRASVNQRETRMAEDLIDQAVAVLERYDLEAASQIRPSLADMLLTYAQRRWTPRPGSLSKRARPT